MEKSRINIEMSNQIIVSALEIIKNLWSDSKSTFWRSTVHRDRASEENKFYPTVSLRCTETLLSTYLTNPESFSNGIKDLLFENVIPKLLSIELDEIDSSLYTGNNADELNEFTLLLYIQTFCLIKRVLDDQSKISITNEKLEMAIRKLANHSFVQNGVDTNFRNEHPFILFHAIRALKSAAENIENKELTSLLNSLLKKTVDGVLDITEVLLSKSVIGTLSPSDSVALAFCSASLAQIEFSKNYQHIVASLKIAINSQDVSGCWPMGRVVHQNKDIESPRLEISTHEIAWALTLTCLRLSQYEHFNNGNLDSSNLHEKLLNSLGYVKKSIEHISTEQQILSGWCSARPYNFKIIESWTSANVLHFAISLNILREQLNLHRVLSSFSTLHPKDKDWPSWLRWRSYVTNSETNHDFPTLKYLDENLISVILDNPQELPSPENRSVSTLLFGPPGTSKTTIVKAVADGLTWPIVLLNPGQFIEGGLESIERMARDVFDRLMQLKKVVVIFDECDELFRDRVPSQESEQTRGITAFVTACMLPKLQELHDRGKIVFFICTNNFETIDSAIKRGGRIDHIIGIGPPDLKARKKIIDFTMNQLLLKNEKQPPLHLNEACEKLSELTAGFIRSELLRATNLLFENFPFKNESDTLKSVRTIVGLFENSLTITKDELSKFEDLNKKFSHNLIES